MTELSATSARVLYHVVLAGNVSLDTVASRLSNVCETEGYTPGRRARLPLRSINDRYVVRPTALTTDQNPSVRVLRRPEKSVRIS